jgi:OOP family OmpA-OmpF porin
VLAALDSLALMKEGRVEVTPGLVTLEGWAATADAEARAAALLAQKAGGPVELAIDFDAAAAEAEAQARAAAEDPAGACLDGVRSVLAGRGIGFQPGSATLSDEGLAAVAAIGAVLANCPPLDLEIAGHTDASGSAAANLALSQDRALAVQFALQAIGLPQLRFAARGYGPDRPIADNDTEEGRARNRRIEFALVGREETPPAPEAESEADPDPLPSQTENRIGPQ